MKKILLMMVGIICLTFFTNVSYAVTVDEIVDKANKMAFYQGKDGKARVEMTITDNQGRTRMREFTILRLDKEDGGEQKFYVHFKKPADVRNMVFMVWKHIGSDDDRWLYLPALDLVRRISANDERTSFAGSDFLYEDVSGRGIEEDTHELIEETDKYYILNNVPKEKSAVEFASYKVWVDKKNFLPTKIEYYDQGGNKYRIIEALEVKDIQGYPTVVKSKVSNLKTGGNTVSEFKKVQYDVGLGDDVFTERYLRRAPRKWVR
ncbi:MAG: outer membrane lipoprotein-sorting protein [Candidatus Ancaeobacter aquaticus]|nr:outer membrane lipoprotein-sorting protein [Candidatus Ancaeobacter aquaticus]